MSTNSKIKTGAADFFIDGGLGELDGLAGGVATTIPATGALPLRRTLQHVWR